MPLRRIPRFGRCDEYQDTGDGFSDLVLIEACIPLGFGALNFVHRMRYFVRICFFMRRNFKQEQFQTGTSDWNFVYPLHLAPSRHFQSHIRPQGTVIMQRSLQASVLAFAFGLVVVSLAGCRGQGLFPPAGTINQQQAQAVVHDPFPQNDIGPYEAASRPPSYQLPLPEPVRNRIGADSMPW